MFVCLVRNTLALLGATRRAARFLFNNPSVSPVTHLLSTRMATQDVNMSYQLSGGTLKKLLNSGDDDALWQAGHTFQILSLKKVAGAREGNGPDRYRLIISDGEQYVQSMLATQLSHMVEDRQLQKNTIIQADKVTCNLVKGRRYGPSQVEYTLSDPD